MRTGLFISIFLAAATGAEPSSDEARALIERAVKVQGGLEALSQPGAAHSKIQGRFFENMEFSGEVQNGGAGKLRLTMHFKDQGTRLVILNGGKGWLQFDGITQAMSEETLARNLKARYVDRVCGLVNLLRDKRYTFTSLGESNIEDKPALGVKVASAGEPDVSLYFDKASGFMVKSAFHRPENEDREVTMETYYRDYELVDCAAAAEKTLRNAQRGLDAPALVSYLRDNIPNAETRGQIQMLIAQLGDASFARRQQATSALVKHGLKAGALLQQARTHSDIEVARRAAGCLESLAEERTLAAAVVRFAAARRSADLESLIAYFPWAPDDAVAREVEDALLDAIRRQAKPDPLWEKQLRNEDPRIQKIAAAALGKDGGAYLDRPRQRLFVDGLRLPRLTNTFVDGKKRLDLETTERDFYNRLEETLFEEPVNGQAK